MWYLALTHAHAKSKLESIASSHKTLPEAKAVGTIAEVRCRVRSGDKRGRGQQQNVLPAGKKYYCVVVSRLESPGREKEGEEEDNEKILSRFVGEEDAHVGSVFSVPIFANTNSIAIELYEQEDDPPPLSLESKLISTASSLLAPTSSSIDRARGRSPRKSRTIQVSRIHISLSIHMLQATCSYFVFSIQSTVSPCCLCLHFSQRLQFHLIFFSLIDDNLIDRKVNSQRNLSLSEPFLVLGTCIVELLSYLSPPFLPQTIGKHCLPSSTTLRQL